MSSGWYGERTREGGAGGRESSGEGIQAENKGRWPWLLWLSGLNAGLQITGSLVGFPV